jgi:hypothetical protein
VFYSPNVIFRNVCCPVVFDDWVVIGGKVVKDFQLVADDDCLVGRNPNEFFGVEKLKKKFNFFIEC